MCARNRYISEIIIFQSFGKNDSVAPYRAPGAVVPPQPKSPHVTLLDWHSLMPFQGFMYTWNGNILEIMLF